MHVSSNPVLLMQLCSQLNSYKKQCLECSFLNLHFFFAVTSGRGKQILDKSGAAVHGYLGLIGGTRAFFSEDSISLYRCTNISSIAKSVILLCKNIHNSFQFLIYNIYLHKITTCSDHNHQLM